jgi:DNA-binding HxlR family transcriptional regulator
MAQGSYRQFCPVAMAAEVLCTRWTIVLLRELVAGSTRFNDLRRGVPRMSPALLSQRLKDLQAAGVVVKVAGASGVAEYRLTRRAASFSRSSRPSASGASAGSRPMCRWRISMCSC